MVNDSHVSCLPHFFLSLIHPHSFLSPISQGACSRKPGSCKQLTFHGENLELFNVGIEECVGDPVDGGGWILTVGVPEGHQEPDVRTLKLRQKTNDDLHVWFALPVSASDSSATGGCAAAGVADNQQGNTVIMKRNARQVRLRDSRFSAVGARLVFGARPRHTALSGVRVSICALWCRPQRFVLIFACVVQALGAGISLPTPLNTPEKTDPARVLRYAEDVYSCARRLQGCDDALCSPLAGKERIRLQSVVDAFDAQAEVPFARASSRTVRNKTSICAARVELCTTDITEIEVYRVAILIGCICSPVLPAPIRLPQCSGYPILESNPGLCHEHARSRHRFGDLQAIRKVICNTIFQRHLKLGKDVIPQHRDKFASPGCATQEEATGGERKAD